MKTHYQRRRRLAQLHCEPLEQRAFLSTLYTAINLSRLVPTAEQDGLQGIQITNGGLIALDVSDPGAGDQNSYIYSLNRRHLYSQPTGYELHAINNAGDAAFVDVSNNDAIIEVAGQMVTVPASEGPPHTIYFIPSSINSSGETAGTYHDKYFPQEFPGAYNYNSNRVYGPSGTSLADEGG